MTVFFLLEVPIQIQVVQWDKCIYIYMVMMAVYHRYSVSICLHWGHEPMYTQHSWLLLTNCNLGRHRLVCLLVDAAEPWVEIVPLLVLLVVAVVPRVVTRCCGVAWVVCDLLLLGMGRLGLSLLCLWAICLIAEANIPTSSSFCISETDAVALNGCAMLAAGRA